MSVTTQYDITPITVQASINAAFNPGHPYTHYRWLTQEHARSFQLSEVPLRTLLFINGIGPYPEDHYQITGTTLTLTGYQPEPEDDIQLLAQH